MKNGQNCHGQAVAQRCAGVKRDSMLGARKRSEDLTDARRRNYLGGVKEMVGARYSSLLLLAHQAVRLSIGGAERFQWKHKLTGCYGRLLGRCSYGSEQEEVDYVPEVENHAAELD